MHHDYIKLSDVLDSIDDWVHIDRYYHPEDYEDQTLAPGIPVEEMKLRVKQCAAADVRPVVRGEWILKHHKMLGPATPCCSECGKFEPMVRNYCPNCGADMRKEDGTDV